MQIARSSRATTATGAVVAVLALAIAAAPVAADGLPLPVEESPSGVLAPDGADRFLSVTIGGATAVLAQKAATGEVTSRADLRGRFGVPLVAYDSTAGGISADGRTLVLIRPRTRFPRTQTTLAVLSAKPSLRLRRLVRLRGDFSYDALSPDGRSLFLVNYVAPADPRKYRVRVYDLVANRLDPEPIVDPRESPDEMNGLPVTRVSSPDGRWAYTLYDGTGEHPFVHALDTRDRKAVCIDLEGPLFERRNPYELDLAVAAGGRRLDVTRKGAPLATVDTTTFRVAATVAPAAARATRAADAAGAGAIGPAAGWAAPAAAAALLLAGLLLAARRLRGRPPARLARRGSGRRSRPSPPTDASSRTR